MTYNLDIINMINQITDTICTGSVFCRVTNSPNIDCVFKGKDLYPRKKMWVHSFFSTCGINSILTKRERSLIKDNVQPQGARGPSNTGFGVLRTQKGWHNFVRRPRSETMAEKQHLI